MDRKKINESNWFHYPKVEIMLKLHSFNSSSADFMHRIVISMQLSFKMHLLNTKESTQTHITFNWKVQT